MIKRIKVLFTLLIIFILTIMAINFYMLNYSKAYILDDKEVDIEFKKKSQDCAIILGASVRADGMPSEILKLRLDKGIDLYNKGLVKKLLLTGDNGKVEYNEVEVMKDYILAKGISGEDIFLDHAGFSTYESMYRAKKVFNVKKAIVITQDFHQPRAVYIGSKLGLSIKGVPCEDVNRDKNNKDLMREVFARTKDFMKMIVKPKPTYLGEIIDISGDGYPSW